MKRYIFTGLVGIALSSFSAELALVTSDLLYTDDALVIWQADGNTRVPAEGNAPAGQVWAGHALRARAEGELVDGASASQPVMQTVKIQAARREFETFQVILTPKESDLTVQDVQISDFVFGDAVISKENVQCNLVGYIYGQIQPRGDQWMKEATPGDVIGPYPDILLPSNAWKTAMVGENYTQWITVQVPANAVAGTYTAMVTVSTAAGAFEVPVELTVWDFELPTECSIDSNLMSLDLSSLCYFYRVAPWEDRARELVDQWADLMVQHRFSPALVPEYPRSDMGNFPVRIDGRSGKCLSFEGNEMMLAGPDDWQMKDQFSLSFWLKASPESTGRILEEQWLSALQSPSGLRPVGHAVCLEDGNLVAQIGHGTWNPTDPAEKKIFENIGMTWKAGPTHSAVKAPWPADDQWHHVALVYQPGGLQLLIDGKPVAKTELTDTMSSSYGIVALGGPDSHFEIDELRWTADALSPEQVAAEMNSAAPVAQALSAYGFEENLYDFAEQKKRVAEEGTDEEYAFKRAAWWVERGLYINTFATSLISGLDGLPQLKMRSDRLRSDGLLDKCVAVVPHDETPFGPKAEENRVFAKAVHEQIPGLKTYVTFGGMKGGSATKAEKAGAVTAYRVHADVWSMIPSIFGMFYETHFKETIAEGAKFSPYIHRADVTQDDLTTAASRRFFWYLWKYDLDQFTLWCTTLWSQPSKMGETRAAKRTWPVENGLMTMKRNHGISDGCMFYPGGDGLVGSIRAACWRDGIEDYEYLKILSGLAENADPSDPAVKAAAALLAEMRDIQVYGKNWEKPPTKDSGFFYASRRRIAAAIMALQ